MFANFVSFVTCNLDKRSMHSLDFTVNRFFMKLFQISDMEIVICLCVKVCLGVNSHTNKL